MGEYFIQLLLGFWFLAFGARKLIQAVGKADDKGLVKKAAQDGAVRVISRILK